MQSLLALNNMEGLAHSPVTKSFRRISSLRCHSREFTPAPNEFKSEWQPRWHWSERGRVVFIKSLSDRVRWHTLVDNARRTFSQRTATLRWVYILLNEFYQLHKHIVSNFTLKSVMASEPVRACVTLWLLCKCTSVNPSAMTQTNFSLFSYLNYFCVFNSCGGLPAGQQKQPPQSSGPSGVQTTSASSCFNLCIIWLILI